MKLYTYFRSGAAYRVRIALHLKNLDFDSIPVDLLQGAQLQAGFTRTNPAHLIPVLEDGADRVSQSLAIIEYLDERFPDPPLLPETSAADRAWVRQLALSIACDVHPLNNLRVLKYLSGPLQVTEERKNQWARHWIGRGFAALEEELAQSPRRGRFCFGDAPTLADCVLVPQMVNSARFHVDLGPYPVLREIERNCQALEAFQRAHPSRQPDAS